MNIGDSIKQFRKKRGLSQKDLAKMVGISPNALCSIEKNYSFPSRNTVKAICKALDISAALLLFASITDEDVPKEKMQVFKALQKPLIEALEDRS